MEAQRFGKKIAAKEIVIESRKTESKRPSAKARMQVL
jgi:hypothetical protein